MNTYHLLNDRSSIKFLCDKMAGCSNQLHPSIEGLKKMLLQQIITTFPVLLLLQSQQQLRYLSRRISAFERGKKPMMNINNIFAMCLEKAFREYLRGEMVFLSACNATLLVRCTTSVGDDQMKDIYLHVSCQNHKICTLNQL
jgi:hypothetical protein